MDIKEKCGNYMWDKLIFIVVVFPKTRRIRKMHIHRDISIC